MRRSKLATLVLAGLLALGSIACENNDEPAPEETPEDEATPEEEETPED